MSCLLANGMGHHSTSGPDMALCLLVCLLAPMIYVLMLKRRVSIAFGIILCLSLFLWVMARRVYVAEVFEDSSARRYVISHGRVIAILSGMFTWLLCWESDRRRSNTDVAERLNDQKVRQLDQAEPQ
jgi:hypothetical protein